MVAPATYTLAQAQKDIAALRGQLAHLEARGVAIAHSDNTVITLTNPTSMADLTTTWPLYSGDMQVSTLYILEVQFNGLWEASGALNLGWDLDGVFTNLVPLGASLATAGHNYGGVIRYYLQIATTGAGGTYNIWTDGGATDTSVNRTGSTSTDLNGIATAKAIDTTSDHTLAASADFGVSNASQTIISRCSNLYIIDWVGPT